MLTGLYRIGINTAKNYLASVDRRAPTTTNYDSEDAVGFDDHEQFPQTLNQSMDRLPEKLRVAIILREAIAEDLRPLLDESRENGW